MPLTSEDLLARLAELGIETRTVTHPPVFTVAEAKELRGKIEGGHCKTLFLRNKKGHMWLLAMLEDRQADLRALGATLGSGRLSFGSADRLMKHLGVIPGAVTPFAAINDTGGQVTVVLERRMLEISPLNFHPLENDRTTAIAADDLVRFLRAIGHEPLVIEVPTSGELDSPGQSD